MELKDKVAIITGAGSGIGAATAKLLASNGATVIVSDINQEEATQVVNEIISANGNARNNVTDVSQYDQVQALMQGTMDTFGKIDILVNNAGIANKTMAKTAEHPIDEWDQVIAINQSGVFYCMKEGLKVMTAQRQGNIVNVASLAGLKASGNNIAYSASKFAVVGMTKSAAMEYAAKNIRINCVCPGYTESALLRNVLDNQEGLSDKLLHYIPMRRFGQPEEIAEAILWLASDKTRFITGQSITLDGGLSL